MTRKRKKSGELQWLIGQAHPVYGFPELVGCFISINILLSILGIIKSILVAELSSMSISNCFWNPFTHEAHATTCSKESHNSTQQCRKSTRVFHVHQTLLIYCWGHFFFLTRNPFFWLLFSNKEIKCNQASNDSFGTEAAVIKMCFSGLFFFSPKPLQVWL